jgi:succinate dehydrogenase hydrophobic anchor subunit
MWKTEVPAEVEEASKEVKRLGTAALIAGIILVVLAIYIIAMIAMNPSIPYLGLPLVAIIIFGVMAGSAFYAASLPSTIQKMWTTGQYRESDKQLRSMLVLTCLGGIVPGVFALRTISCLDPVTERTPPPSPQIAPSMPCPRCSAPMTVGDRFCKVCGTPSNPPPQT